MSFVKNIKTSLNAVVFKEKAIKQLAENKNATKFGFLTLILAGVAVGISQLNILKILLEPISLIIGFFIIYSVYHFLAKFIFRGKATGTEYFRSFSNCFVLIWFTFIPILGSILQTIAGLWLLGLNVFVLNKVHKLSMWKSILIVLIPIIIVVILLLGSGLFYFDISSPSYMVPPR